jgi:hypothetical protein
LVAKHEEKKEKRKQDIIRITESIPQVPTTLIISTNFSISILDLGFVNAVIVGLLTPIIIFHLNYTPNLIKKI